jgi:hypothetical protein
MFSSSGSVIIANRLKAKYSFCTATMLLFYNLQKYYHTKICTHLNKIYFQDSSVNTAVGYGLDGCRIGVLFLARAKEFFSSSQQPD